MRINGGNNQEVAGCRGSRLKAPHFLILPILLLAGCMSNGKSTSNNTAPANTSLGGLLPTTGILGPGGTVVTTTGTLNISIGAVIASPGAPVGTSIDIADGSDQSIGEYCFDNAVPNTTCSPNCQCVFDYTDSSGNPVSNVQVAPTLCEEDMMRCPTGILPTNGTNYFVQIASGNDYTREDQFSLPGTATPTLSSSYAKVQRFMCRQFASIPYVFDGRDPTTIGGMYDPIQSEDPVLTFPITYYTSNPGSTVWEISTLSGTATAGSNLQQWDCNLNSQNPPYWETLLLYSQDTAATAPNATPNPNVIVAANGADNARNQFYVSTQASGIFTTPVYGMMVPPSYTSGDTVPNTTSDILQPLGYGVAPVSGACPSSAAIPSNLQTTMQWAKLYLFKASFPSGSFTYASKGAGITDINEVSCNFGPVGGYFASTPSTAANPDCGAEAYAVGPAVSPAPAPQADANDASADPSNDGTHLAARLIALSTSGGTTLGGGATTTGAPIPACINVKVNRDPTATGNISTTTTCISGLSFGIGTYGALVAGLSVYDATNPANVSSGVTIAGLPGSCSAGQVQMSAVAAKTAAGDTFIFGGAPTGLVTEIVDTWHRSGADPNQLVDAVALNGCGFVVGNATGQPAPSPTPTPDYTPAECVASTPNVSGYSCTTSPCAVNYNFPVPTDYVFVVLPYDVSPGASDFSSNTNNCGTLPCAAYVPARFSRVTDSPSGCTPDTGLASANPTPNATYCPYTDIQSVARHPVLKYSEAEFITSNQVDPGFPICVLQNIGLPL